MTYEYSSKEKQESNNPYSFTDYQKGFLEDYEHSRPKFVKIEISKGDIKSTDTTEKLKWLYNNVECAELKEFRKKGDLRILWNKLKGLNGMTKNSDEQDLEDYEILAQCLSKHHEITGCLQSLSTLLKVNDRILAYGGRPAKEIEFVKELIKKLKPLRERLEPVMYYPINSAVCSVPFGMICQDKIRSRAYIQIMCKAGCKPKHVIILGVKSFDKFDEPVTCEYFNAEEPVHVTCEKNNIKVTFLETEFNNSATIKVLSERQEEYFVFSGSGILKEKILGAKKLIHAHAGILPNYRGSTTFLYSLISEGKCGVTTFIMNPGIDTGDILLKKEFLPPAADIDIDRIYDAYIRAVAMAETIQNLGKLDPKKQEAEGETYFVMHPVLRNLAAMHYKDQLRH